MYYSIAMTSEFEIKKNQRAFLYTTAIVVALLLLFILIKWPITPTPKPIVEDYVQIDLGDIDAGNIDEGKGDIAPMVKGDPAPSEPQANPQPSSSNDEASNVQPDETEKDNDAAEVPKTTPTKINNTPRPVTQPTTKPTTQPVASNPTPKPAPKPKITMPGGTGTGGNGANEDNYSKGQGNGNGNGGVGNGGNGGTGTGGNGTGGTRPPSQPPRNINHYSFAGDLPKATIYANIKVSANGVGSFISIGKNSTSTDRKYADDIRERLRHMEFSKFDRDYTQMVTFYYKEN